MPRMRSTTAAEQRPAAMLDAGERAHQPRDAGDDQVRPEHDDERQQAVAGTAQADQAGDQGDDADDRAQRARGRVADDRLDELEDARHQQVEAEDDPDREQRDVGVDDGQHAAHERYDAQARPASTTPSRSARRRPWSFLLCRGRRAKLGSARGEASSPASGEAGSPARGRGWRACPGSGDSPSAAWSSSRSTGRALLLLGALLSGLQRPRPGRSARHRGHRRGAQRARVAHAQPPRASAERAHPGRRRASCSTAGSWPSRRGDQPRRHHQRLVRGRRGRRRPGDHHHAASALLAIDDDETWQRNVVRRQARRAGAIASDVPGVVFLEIDGLAHEVAAARAARRQRARHGALAARGHPPPRALGDRLVLADRSVPGGAAARQQPRHAGLPLVGEGPRPAIVTNHPRDAQELERRHSDGRGLLHEDGASRANILSGDAPHSMLTMSTVLVRGRGRLGRDYAAYFARPYAVIAHRRCSPSPTTCASAARRRARSATTCSRGSRAAHVRAGARVGDGRPARPAGLRHRRRHDAGPARRLLDLPRLRRGRPPLGHRAPRHARRPAPGRPPDRPGRSWRSPTPRGPYELVVLSDHGQSQGATFADRWGVTLEDLVRAACDAGRVEAHAGGEDEALAYLGAGLTEVAGDDSTAGRAVASATRERRAGGAVTLGAEARAEIEAGDELPEIVVMASGCLGLVSFPREPGRVTPRAARRAAPAPRRRRCATIPASASSSCAQSSDGAVVLGARRAPTTSTRSASRARTRSRPSAPTPPPTCAAPTASRTAPTCSSTPPTRPTPTRSPPSRSSSARTAGWAAASRCPSSSSRASCTFPDEQVVGAEHMHRVLRGWLVELGHDAYRDEAELTRRWRRRFPTSNVMTVTR